MKDQLRFFQLAPDKIAELIFLLEGEDGVAVVRTLDSDRGIIEVLIAPGFEKDFNQLLNMVSSEFRVKEIEKPPNLGSIADGEINNCGK